MYKINKKINYFNNRIMKMQIRNMTKSCFWRIVKLKRSQKQKSKHSVSS